MYSDCNHGLVPWKLLTFVLVPWERGNSRLKSLALLTEVQLGMYSESSHGLVPWELPS